MSTWKHCNWKRIRRLKVVIKASINLQSSHSNNVIHYLENKRTWILVFDCLTRNNSKLWPLVFFSEQVGKGVFRDAWWDPNYQRDAWSGPNESCKAWFGLAALCVSSIFTTRDKLFSSEISVLVNIIWNKKQTLKIDSYDTGFLPFFLLSRPLISSDQMIIYTCLSRITPIFFKLSRITEK